MFEKTKVSIDFTRPEYELVKAEAKRKEVSNSSVINGLVAHFLTLSDMMKYRLSKFCDEQFLKGIEEYQNGSIDELEVYELNQWKKLSDFFRVDTENIETEKKRKLQLKNGYVVFPSRYLYLEEVGKAQEHNYVGVLSCQNGLKYDVPTFIFACDFKYAREYTDELEEAVYEEAKKAWPRFSEIFNMQDDYDSVRDGFDIERFNKWKEAPCFGFFHIVEKGDPLYWNSINPNYQPPDGAMIVRTIKEN